MTLRKLPQCFDCQYHDLTGHLVCALHPSGPCGDRCSDFVAMVSDRPSAIAEVAKYGHWAPEGWAFEGGELMRLAASDVLMHGDRHPIVSGRCPQCGHEYDLGIAWVHWDCPSCRWKDDSI